MKKVNKIIQNEKFQTYLQKIEEYEKDREFCKHDMTHFLDVCRIGEIFRLQTEVECKNIVVFVDTEMMYAAGLLHDIGRFRQYESGIPHEIASAELAPEILLECGFYEDDIEEICLAISNHRNPEIKDEKTLSGFLYRADKLSRPCFACKAENRCDWKLSKKNLEITF